MNTPKEELFTTKSVLELGEIITILDNTKLSFLSEDEISKLIRRLLPNLPEDNSDALGYLNELYVTAIEYLKKELLYTDKEIGSSNLNRTFNSFSDVVDFLKDTKGLKGRIKCSIAKVAFTICDTYEKFNDRIRQVKDKTDRVIENKLKKPIQILEENEDGDIRGVVNWKGETINFTMTKREKSDESATSKGIREPKYYSQEYNSDLYGVTFKVKNKSHIPLFMEYVSICIFKKGVFEVKNKGILRKGVDKEGNEYIVDGEKLDFNFESKLLDSVKVEKKDESGEDYGDVKMHTPLYKDDSTKNMSFEVKFVHEENINEYGLNMQGVYGYFKKIKERIRLEQYVTEEYIERIVDQFIEDLPKILETNINRKNKDVEKYKVELFQDLRKNGHIGKGFKLNSSHVKSNIDMYLSQGLVGNFRSKLRRVNKGNKSNSNKSGRNKRLKTLFTNKRAIKLAELGYWETMLTPET